MVTLKPAVVLGILGAIALAGLVFLVIRVIKAKKTGTPALGAAPSGLAGMLQSFLANPLVQRFATHAVSAAEATHHAALDAGIVKVAPFMAPFVPIVNDVADKVDSAVLARVGGEPAPAPAPSDLAAKVAAAEKVLADLKAHFGS